MRRPFWIGIVLACLLIMLSGCVGREAPKESAPEEALTVVDSAGRLVVIPQPVERVVSVFSYADVAMCILGVPEKLVGCSSFVKKNKEQFPQLAHAADVGWAWNPNWEVIYSLKPQVLLVPATWGEDISKYVDKCEPAGIKVVCLDLKPAAFNRDLMILAKIIGAEERARQHIAWRNHYIDLIRRRVRSLKEEEKVSVYIEGWSEWSTASEGSAYHQCVTIAGGKNIAAELEGEYPKVSPEWVLEHNPDVIIKVSYKTGVGYTVSDTSEVEALRNEIMNRAILKDTKAVREGRVYVIKSSILLKRSEVGIAYIAKWLYPDLFEDLDPKQIHKEWFEKWFGAPYRGVWAYPEP